LLTEWYTPPIPALPDSKISQLESLGCAIDRHSDHAPLALYNADYACLLRAITRRATPTLLLAPFVTATLRQKSAKDGAPTLVETVVEGDSI
jgi:hypothetical protein